MVEASVVEKEKARVALETEVRSGGPTASLIEAVAAGNTYRLECGPLERIRLALYVSLIWTP